MANTTQRRGGRPFSRQTLERWIRSPRGRRLLALEERQLRCVLPEVFGRQVLQVGSWGRGDELLLSSETLHRSVLGSVPDLGAGGVADPEQLPVLTRSVDAVVLPHTLEFVTSPHNVLREADRVLTDRGRLFIIGFNPWGSWVMRERLGLRYRMFPASGRYYSVRRVSDWLELLGYEIVDVRRFSAGLPWNRPSSTHDSWSFDTVLAPFSEAYLMVARKRVLPMTLLGRPQRAQVRPLIGAAMPTASSAAAPPPTRFNGEEPG